MGAGLIKTSEIAVFPKLKYLESVTVTPATETLALMVPADPFWFDDVNPLAVMLVVATPVGPVSTVPDNGDKPVSAKLSPKVTSVLPTGFPLVSNTVAEAVIGHEALTTLAVQPAVEFRVKVIDGVEVDPAVLV